VYKNDGVTWQDTNFLAWETTPGMPGSGVKILARAPSGEPAVVMRRLPAGDSSDAPPHRASQGAPSEFTFVLEGEYPSWEYASPDQARGELIWARRECFSEREPGSIHGVEPGPSSLTGATVLAWHNGSAGAGVGGPQGADVPYPEGTDFSAPGGPLHAFGSQPVRAAGGVTWIDTRELSWEPMPEIGSAGFMHKVLARDAEGEPSVTLVFIPPGGLSYDGQRHRHYHPNIREFVYVLAGEYPGTEYVSPDDDGTQVLKRSGCFMVRETNSLHGVEPHQATPTGAIILNWRDSGPGIWVGEKNWQTECVDVPFDDEG
jgi:hypothetical protein